MKKVVEFSNKRSIDSEAWEWLIRFDGDSPLSKEERDEFSEWVNRNRAHGRRIRELAELWGELNVLTEVAVPLIQPHSPIMEPAKSSRSIGNILAASVAGAVLIAIVAGAIFWYQANPLEETNGFYATAIGDQMSAALADGSVVQLNTNTQIRVSYGRYVRDIHLFQGEAHFTVAENEKMPFRVFAGARRIDAVGTAFSVYVKEDVIDVTVTEGRVELATISRISGGPTGVTAEDATPVVRLAELVAGQAASLSRRLNVQESAEGALENVRSIEDEDISRMLSWREGVLLFSGETLENVVAEISRYTTVTIELADSDVRSIRIGGRFPVAETEELFTSLESDFSLQVTRVSNSHVILSARDAE